MFKFLESIAVASMVFFTCAAHAEQGVTKTEIRIGSTGSLTGPSGEYGVEMEVGARAYYQKINAQGGIHGRKINFTTLDDKYEPATAAKNAESLVKQHDIFAFVGGNGTPTIKVVMPVMKEAKVPLLFPYSGATFLRSPMQENIFNLRIGYDDENRDLVDLVVKKLGQKEIGVLYQSDALGEAGLSGVRNALEKNGIRMVRSASYTRNTDDVDQAVESLMKDKPKVVFLEGTSNPCAAFIRKAAEKGYKPIYVGWSPLRSSEMHELLKGVQYELYVSEVMPLLTNTGLPLVQEYQKDMQAAGVKKSTMITMEGYLGAKIFVEAAKRAGKDLTRKGLVTALESMKNFNLGGAHVSFSSTNHQGFNKAFINKITAAGITPLE